MKTIEKTVMFEMNGKAYRTDPETLNVLRSIVPSAKATGDHSAVGSAAYAAEGDQSAAPTRRHRAAGRTGRAGRAYGGAPGWAWVRWPAR